MHLTLGLIQYFSAMLEFVSTVGGNQLLTSLHNEIIEQKNQNPAWYEQIILDCIS